MSPTPRRILVAINPDASFGRNQNAGRVVVAALSSAGCDVTALQESSVDLLRLSLRRALAERPDALVVVGGDGMVSLAVNELADTRIPLGIVPSGTGNDTARGLGIPLGDPAAAIRTLLAALDAPRRVIDVGVVRHGGSETRFAGIVSAGFDALVNERANAWRRPRGKSRYTLALLRELISLAPRRYELSVDGTSFSVDAVLLSVANNGSLGGGMRIVPHARVDDGVLDLFTVAPLGRLRLLRFFPKVFSGTHTTLDLVAFRTLRTVRIDAPGIVAYADGERIGPLPIDIEILPAALHVLI
ncbi:diacylglycerol kinase family protein [Mycetocola sp.]|uniref:diacylglycerol/lipid kinase family protein n=1 Tax=Mycetocola sp. TaxID=1871042 RepID=UPI00260D1937|nr:diacylglycerol kinase family protein [Mycetocola sp.]MCU1418893.1 Diacylglycerol kinase [Mycetocola sp.]MCU1561364.1 Diacylglycerol kinase [Mycetocola sp.]